MVNGTHVRTSVTKKDLFIWDEDDLKFGFFPEASGGIVCHSIKNTEWTGEGHKSEGKRIVNNNRETSSGSAQYGVHIRIATLMPRCQNLGYAYNEPDMLENNPPNGTWLIEIDINHIKDITDASWLQKHIDSVIAHELGHAAKTEHHHPDLEGGILCIMRYPPNLEPTDATTGTSFCTEVDKCKGKLDVKDP